MDTQKSDIKPFIDNLEHMLLNGGPEAEDWDAVEWNLKRIHERTILANGDKKIDPIATLREKYPEILLSLESLIGYTFSRPLGYAGDYQIIDYIYEKKMGTKKITRLWDEYCQNTPCAIAVRNRPAYFPQIIEDINPNHIVSLGAGSGQDVKPIKDYSSIEKVLLIDTDPNALNKAKERYDDDPRVSTLQQNVLRPEFNGTAQLVWSSGLFDYFNDKIFPRVLNRIMNELKTPSTIVIGNFDEGHTSQAYMEVLGRWYLNLRSPDKLRELAIKAGAQKSEINIDRESTGINLFLRISRSP